MNFHLKTQNNMIQIKMNQLATFKISTSPRMTLIK